jgi:hypothetical protein
MRSLFYRYRQLFEMFHEGKSYSDPALYAAGWLALVIEFNLATTYALIAPMHFRELFKAVAGSKYLVSVALLAPLMIGLRLCARQLSAPFVNREPWLSMAGALAYGALSSLGFILASVFALGN